MVLSNGFISNIAIAILDFSLLLLFLIFFILVLALCFFSLMLFLEFLLSLNLKGKIKKIHYFSPSPLKARKSDNYYDNYMRSNIGKMNEQKINLIEKLEE